MYMKKLVLLAVAALMATVSVNAQFEAGKWSIQPKIGLGVSSISHAGDLQIAANTSLSNQITGAALMGAELEYQLVNQVSVAAGLNYTVQGTGWDNFNSSGVQFKDPRVELGYVKVPLVLNYYFAKGWAVKAGVQFGFMTNADVKMRAEGKMAAFGTNRDATIDYSMDMMDDYKKFDVSVPVGISYQFSIPWVLDFRYQWGLTKVNKESVDGQKDMKNNVFMLTFGYKFAL